LDLLNISNFFLFFTNKKVKIPLITI
jgi:hypothetical protein